MQEDQAEEQITYIHKLHPQFFVHKNLAGGASWPYSVTFICKTFTKVWAFPETVAAMLTL